jgi:hypothetical protein
MTNLIKNIKIALFLDETNNDLFSFFEAILQITKIYQKDIPFEYRVYDTEGNADKSNEQMKQAIEDGYRLFIGGITSEELSKLNVFAEFMTFNNIKDVILFSPSSTIESVGNFEFLYRLVQNDSNLPRIFKDLIFYRFKNKLDLNKVAIVYRDDKYGRELVKDYDNTFDFNFKSFKYDPSDAKNDLQEVVNTLEALDARNKFKLIILISFEEASIYIRILSDRNSRLLKVKHFTTCDGLTYYITKKFARETNLEMMANIGDIGSATTKREEFINILKTNQISPSTFIFPYFDCLDLCVKYGSKSAIIKNIDNFHGVTSIIKYRTLDNGIRESSRSTGFYIGFIYDPNLQNWFQSATAGCTRILKDTDDCFFHNLDSTFNIMVEDLTIIESMVCVDRLGRYKSIIKNSNCIKSRICEDLYIVLKNGTKIFSSYCVSPDSVNNLIFSKNGIVQKRLQRLVTHSIMIKKNGRVCIN